MVKLIGVCGLIGSGKDTIAGTLVGIGWQQYSMARPLKDMTAQLFGWPRDMVEGSTEESRKWREQRDDWWSERLGREVTPRWALQHIGTEVMRHHLHDEIWVARMERFYHESGGHVVISDVRFPNEIEAIRRLGGEIWHVRRPPLPTWYRDAALGLEVPGVHITERAWIAISPNRVIINDKDIDSLRKEVLKAVGSI